MKKKISAFIIAVVASALLFGVIAVADMFCLFERIEKPVIKEGEFDFALVYSVDGEEKTFEGTYVCKYDGVTRALDGMGIDWTGYIEGHEDSCSIDIKKEEKGIIKIDLDLSPRFFMGDETYKIASGNNEPKPEPMVYIDFYGDDTGETFEHPLDYEIEGVEIISFTYDEPIENTFR